MRNGGVESDQAHVATGRGVTLKTGPRSEGSSEAGPRHVRLSPPVADLSDPPTILAPNVNSQRSPHRSLARYIKTLPHFRRRWRVSLRVACVSSSYIRSRSRLCLGHRCRKEPLQTGCGAARGSQSTVSLRASSSSVAEARLRPHYPPDI